MTNVVDSNPPPGKLEANFPEPLRRYHWTEFSSENFRVPSPTLLEGEEATGEVPKDDSGTGTAAVRITTVSER